MTFHVDVSRQKSSLFLEILKSLDFVERFRVDEIPPASAKQPSSSLSPFLAKHNGAIPDLDVEAFENHVTETRNEWESNRTY
jgi:hypothetical protein